MNYIEQLNLFHEWLEYNFLSPQAKLLWYELMHFCNKCYWREWMVIDNYRLMSQLGIKSEKTFRAIRDELKEAGFIEVKNGKKNHPTQYKLHKIFRDNNGQLLTQLMLNKVQTDDQIEGKTNVKTTGKTDITTAGNFDANIEGNTKCNIDTPITSQIGGKNYHQSCQKSNAINKQKHKHKQKLEKDIPNGISKKKLREAKKLPANGNKAITDYEDKIVHGEFENVWLKDSELTTLQIKYPDAWEKIIETLSSYKASSGKGYASDYGAINNWVVKRVREELSQNSGRSSPMNSVSGTMTFQEAKLRQERSATDFLTAVASGEIRLGE